MKLKNVLCMAVLSAAVALTGVPVSGAPAVVQAEETQTAGLDEILRQMYALYQGGDHASMYALDTDEATKAYVEAIGNSGSDRYVIDLDGNTKAMLYVSPNGGWWWYFGQMENGLRQGNGTAVLCDSDYTEIFTGSYSADFPNGEGKLSMRFASGSVCDISGSFQGTHLNGVYQVDVNWIDHEGTIQTSSLPTAYANNHLQSLGEGGEELTAHPDPEYGYTRYDFWCPGAGCDNITINYGYEPVAIGISDDGDYSCWSQSSEAINEGMAIFEGNGTPSAYAPSNAPVPEVTVPETHAPEVTVPETPATPQPTVPSGTYTVERGDNLSRIAQKVYGDKNLWRKIYDANKDVIKSDYLIWANQVLVIPE